jgi:hypothetical protein
MELSGSRTSGDARKKEVGDSGEQGLPEDLSEYGAVKETSPEKVVLTST